jgi:peptidoglycan/LPS O-acetylase OafA/YrhL
VISPTSGFPGTAAWLPCLSAALFLHAGPARSSTGLSRILGSAPLKYIGDISYSLYLWHYLWLILPAQLPTPLDGPAVTLVGFIGTFACAAASYHVMENRIRHSTRLQRDGLATGLLLLVCIAISLDATVVIESLYLNR